MRYTMDKGLLETKQLFFNNLQLLGFDVVAMEATNHIPFNKNMFELPNKRGAEIVLHFLFEKLNPTMCREAFRDIWPILDKKREQAFRKTCANWLGNIAQEEPDCHLPRINASLFMSPGGDKFYQLLLYFSAYVLQRILDSELAAKSSERLKYPALSSQNTELGDVMLKNLACSSVRHRKSYFDVVELTLKARKTWKETADDCVKDYRKLSKEIRELDYDKRGEEQRALDNSIARGSPTKRYGKMDNLDPNFDPRTIQRAQRVQHVREMWKQLDEFERTEAAEREIVESIVERTINKHKIDAADILVKVPDMLLRECGEEIRRRNVSNTYQGGRLNLESVLQLWNLSLHLYLEKLKQIGMPKFDNDVKKLTSQVHVQQNYLQNARTLRGQMAERIPVLKASIEKLRAQLDSAMFKDETPTSIRTTSLGLGLVEPSPQLNFSPGAAETPTQQLEVPRSPRCLDTPEAAGRVMEEMRASVKCSPKQLFPGDVELLLQPGKKDSAIPRPTPSKGPSQPSSRQSSRPTSARSSASARGSMKSNKSSTRSTKQESTPRDGDTVFPTVSSPKTMVAKFSQDTEKMDISADSIPLSARSNVSSSARSDKSGNSSSTAKASQSPRSVKSQSSGRLSARSHDQEHEGSRQQGRKTPTDLLVDEIMGEGKILSPFNSGLEAFESRNLVNRTPDLEDENKENVEPSEEYGIRHDYNTNALAEDFTDENFVNLQTNDVLNDVNENVNENENKDINEYNEEREGTEQIEDVESDLDKDNEINGIKLVAGPVTDDDDFEEIHGPEFDDEPDDDGNLSEGSNRSVENVIVIDKSFYASPKPTPVSSQYHSEATNHTPREEKVPSLETSPRELIVIDHSIQRSPANRVDRNQVRRDLLSKSLTLERSPLSEEIRQMFEKAVAETPQRPQSASRLHDPEARLGTYAQRQIDITAPDIGGYGGNDDSIGIDDELELPNMDINSRQTDPVHPGKTMFNGDVLWDMTEGLDDIEMPDFDVEKGFDEGDDDNDMKEPNDDFNESDKDADTEKKPEFQIPGVGDIEDIDDFFLSKTPELPSRHQGMFDRSSLKEDGNELVSTDRSSFEIPKFPETTDEEEPQLITF